MATINILNFPKAIVAFGKDFQSGVTREITECTNRIKEIANRNIQESEDEESHYSNAQASIAYTLELGSIMSRLCKITQDLTNLSNENRNLIGDSYLTTLQGELQALNQNLLILQDENRIEAQVVLLIDQVACCLTKILQFFNNEKFKEYYYISAPLFVPVCVILKALTVIADQLNSYNTAVLNRLKQTYQETLFWYRDKCTGTRLASCYVTAMWSGPGGLWTYDWNRHFQFYNNYYDDGNKWWPWRAYSKDLGGKGWALRHHGSWTYCNLKDTWDTRNQDDIEFETFVTTNTSGAVVGGKLQYHKDVLQEYRRRVETVMLEFFQNASA